MKHLLRKLHIGGGINDNNNRLGAADTSSQTPVTTTFHSLSSSSPSALPKGLHHLSSGTLAKLFKPSSPFVDDVETHDEGVGSRYPQLHDVNISLELKDWIFTLEGVEAALDQLSLLGSDGFGEIFSP
ncbi:hypothetical protein L2E82_50206 [Cichorium intybus]|nr:hypothetical protein L2E82_50206 [Cichorium intybus]